jgi:hypothetical protein
MDVAARIQSILSDDTLDKGGGDVEAIEALIKQFGWELIQVELLRCLWDEKQRNHWYSVAAVFWGATLDNRPMPTDKVIASLYLRLDTQNCTDEEENLAWSITCKLKGVDYSSEYDPLKDPDVLAELNLLRLSA